VGGVGLSASRRDYVSKVIVVRLERGVWKRGIGREGTRSIRN
jgi:hypothetical protein